MLNLTITTLKLVSLGTKFQVFRCYVGSLDKTLRFVTHVGPNTISISTNICNVFINYKVAKAI